MFLFLIPFLFLIIAIWFLGTPTFKGFIGEYRVHKILKQIALKLGGLEFRDLMFEDDKSSSQIDNMLITQKALYVVEVKNYKGMIFGTPKNKDWTVTVKHVNRKKSRSGKTYYRTHISKHKFYNPIKQNKTHINKILNLTNIGDCIPIINIVVFGKRAILKDVTPTPDAYVITQRVLRNLILSIEESISAKITFDLLIDHIDSIYEINILDRSRRKRHVSNLKRRFKTN